MKNDSRIIIRGLSAEAAELLLPIIRTEAKLQKSKGVKIELDHPDPPELFEKEYHRLYDAYDDLDCAIGDGIAGNGDRTTLKEVFADVAHLKKQVNKFWRLVEKMDIAVAHLDEAAYDMDAEKQ